MSTPTTFCLFCKKNGFKSTCSIVKAKLACWRRYPFSSSRIEKGHYACWLFDVYLTRSSETHLSQYEQVHDFPKSRDGCRTFKECGNVTWSCTSVPSLSNAVYLKWSFPKGELASALALAVAFSILLLCVVFREKILDFAYPQSSHTTTDSNAARKLDSTHNMSPIESPWFDRDEMIDREP